MKQHEDKIELHSMLDVANRAASHIERTNVILEGIGSFLSRASQAAEKGARKQAQRLTNGNTVQINFSCMSIYVDNSGGASSVTLTDENGVSFTVAANTQEWVHPMGSSFFDVSTTNANSTPAMFVDRFLPIK